MNDITNREWDEFLLGHPDAHILQTSTWGSLKSGYGWKQEWVIAGDSGAQILFRQLPFGFNIGYIPKGPVGNNWQAVVSQADVLCKKNKAIFLKVEPDQWESDLVNPALKLNGFHPGARTIQPRRTIIIDLEADENGILGRMKQKTRYNIHLAEKKEVNVVSSTNIDAFNSLMAVTANRENFGVHTGKYYQDVYDKFLKTDAMQLFLATFENTPLAAIMVFRRGTRAWYFYGASNNIERNRMPTYLVQWRGMQWAKAQGCKSYDLWGVPDMEEHILENEFEKRSDGLWGVYRFKRGFGGTLKRSMCAWEKVYHPILYRFFQWWQSRRGGEPA